MVGSGSAPQSSIADASDAMLKVQADKAVSAMVIKPLLNRAIMQMSKGAKSMSDVICGKSDA